jgi:hypothetical protein
VYVTLDPAYVPAMSSLVRLVLSGELSRARLSNGPWSVSLCLDEESLRVEVAGSDMRSKCALRLLGFRAGLSAEELRVTTRCPFSASSLLKRVFSTALDAGGSEIEAVLTSGGDLVRLTLCQELSIDVHMP